jgi:hypothetical protein
MRKEKTFCVISSHLHKFRNGEFAFQALDSKLPLLRNQFGNRINHKSIYNKV